MSEKSEKSVLEELMRVMAAELADIDLRTRNDTARILSKVDGACSWVADINRLRKELNLEEKTVEDFFPKEVLDKVDFYISRDGLKPVGLNILRKKYNLDSKAYGTAYLTELEDLFKTVTKLNNAMVNHRGEMANQLQIKKDKEKPEYAEA